MPVITPADQVPSRLPSPVGSTKLLFRQAPAIQTRHDVGSRIVELHATGATHGSFATLDEAIAGAKVASEGDAAAVAVIANGATFALQGVTLLSQNFITFIPSGRTTPFHSTDLQQLSPTAKTFDRFSHLRDLDVSLAAIVDDATGLVPTGGQHASDGTSFLHGTGTTLV